MNYTFVLNTTAGKPLPVTVEGNITMKLLHDRFFDEIEKNTVFGRDEILDIFIHIAHCNETLSIPNNDILVKDFIPMNRRFFPFSPENKNTYSLHAIDRMYRERIDCKPLPLSAPTTKNRDIQTTHMDGFIQRTKQALSFW